ncbi:MAG: MBL fold metallo-hydrolase, partial [Acidimicrobiia bacterium]|nr:MBL fold metallo-hydrolase [Acidimicrobiia bacterium]
MKLLSVPAWMVATNAYIAWNESDGVAVLVDIPPEPELVAAVVLEHKLTVGAVLLTHGHVDHAGGAGELTDKHPSQVFVHPDDDFLTLHPEEQLRHVFGWVPPGSYKLPSQFTPLSHGQVIEVAGLNLETRHTPGHTPGHCCFYEEDEGMLFSGDLLFAGSVGRTDLEGGSWEALVESIKSHVLTLDDEIRVLPGHGP